MSNSFEQWDYFPSPVYKVVKPDFLEEMISVANKSIEEVRKETGINEFYPVIQANILGAEEANPFLDFVINTAWNILDNQGYNMEGLSTYFTEVWCQDHYKFSSMEYHIHNDSHLVAFYFLECPKDPPRLIIHDPRPGKMMTSIPERDINQLTMATSMINFVPEPGILFFAPSWLPHSFTRNTDDSSFKFIHMNISTRPSNEEIIFPPTAEII